MWRCRGRALPFWIGVVMLAGGCSDPPAASRDTGPADAGDADGMVIDEPLVPDPPRIDWLADGAPPVASPASPVLTPCPVGWREVNPFDSLATCDPWPETGIETCAAHEAHFVGQTGCAGVGSDCAADGWPSGLPTTDVVFVRRGVTGGDGSRPTPFGSIADALAVAGPTTTVAVAEGRYAEPLALPGGVALVGACPERTTIAGTVTFAADGASLRGFTVEGATPGIVVTASASLRETVVSAARESGIDVVGGTLDARDLVIRDTVAAGGGLGDGLRVTAGGSATVARAVIESSAHAGVFQSGSGSSATLEDVAIVGSSHGAWIEAGAVTSWSRAAVERSSRSGFTNLRSELSLTDAVVRDTTPEEPGSEGQGVLSTGGAVVLTRTWLHHNRYAGIELRDGSLSADDVVVSETDADSVEPRSGFGMLLRPGSMGSVELRRAHIERSVACGLVANAALVEASDLRVRGTRESVPVEGGATLGCGIDLQSRDATLSRLWVEQNIRSGLLISGPDTVARLSDIAVLDTVGSRGDGKGGEGISVLREATVTADRVLLERGQFAGLIVQLGAEATIRDVASRDITAPRGFGISGTGIRVELGGRLTLERALVERGRLAGIHVVDTGSSLVATDVVVRDMLGDEMFGLHGWGLAATAGATVELARASFERPRYIGLVAAEVGSRITATDIVLQDTLEAACAEDLCIDAAFGVGVGAYRGGVVEAQDFVLTRSHLIGVQLATGGVVDLVRGEVSLSPIGANIQTDDFELERLTQDVSYRENAVNLVTDSLPVPGLD